MHRNSQNLVFEPEIERILRKARSERRKRNKKVDLVESEGIGSDTEDMAGRRITLEDVTSPNLDGCGSSVAPPPVPANNFEIKPAMIQLIKSEQFAGLEEEDPNQHIHNFLQICGTIKMNGVPDDAIKLSLFEFSLKGEAKCWLQSFPPGFFTSWDSLVTNFLAQFFPPDRYNHFRAEISCFKQRDGESITEAWKRFKSFLRKCPHHGFSDLQQLHIFYNGLKTATRALVDASAGGSLRKKSAEEAREIIETMASNRYDTSDYFVPRQAKGVMELGKEDALLAQNRLLTQQIEALTAQLKAVQVNSLHVLQTPHPPLLNYEFGTNTAGQGGAFDPQGLYDETAQVNFLGNVPRTIPFSQNGAFNSYSYRNHPNLSYKSDNYLKPPPVPYQNQHPPIPSQNQPPQYNQHPYNNQRNYHPPANQFHQPHTNQQSPSHSQHATQNHQTNTTSSNIENTLLSFMKETQSLFKNQDATIRNLEGQIAQLSKHISERPPGSFPADTVPNPKEHCKAILTRGGKVELHDPP